MAIVPGTQICVPATPVGHALGVIRAMEELLARRKVCMVTRRQFLTKWAKLRTALFLTEEYQQLRVRTMARCRGRCTQSDCSNIAVHIHHLKSVAYYPQLALLDSNVIGICGPCHRKEETRVKKERLLKASA